MNPGTILAIVIAVVGAVLAFGGQRLSLPVLSYAGTALLGVAGVVVGLEAMIKRRMVLPSRYYRYRDETYVGVAGVAQGGLFVLIGAFLMGVSILAYLDTGRAVFLHFVRRPGLPLLTMGLFCLLTATASIAGYVEQSQTERWVFILDLLTSRLLPGLILIVIGLGATGLGLFEVLAPQAFDGIGGGFLQVLFGAS
jgi:hypothetical protein